MSLTSSLFTGISGLGTLGNSMQIIGDNIANVNTVGFKGSRYVFQDVLSQAVATQAGTSQIGRGTAMGDVASVFEQGSFESTGNTTDLGISGDGFFVVREANSEQLFYTRAGNFEFDKTGYLTSPEGYVVQGWELNNEGEDQGAVTDILLSSFTSSPDATNNITVITNVDADQLSNSEVLTNTWDGTNTTPVASSNYEYQTTVTVYDSLGSTHDVTIYYDKKSGSDWEYLVACAPAEDKRNGVRENTPGTGLLAKGTVTFSDSSGKISNITMKKFTGLVGNVDTVGTILPADLRVTVNDYDKLPLDGHGFTLTHNPVGTWALTGTSTALSNYITPLGSSVIAATSNEDVVNIDLDADGESDITINLDKSAQNNDAITFDINDPLQLHVQTIKPQSFSADTFDNTTMSVLNPEVLTANDTGITLSWVAANNSWTLGAFAVPEYLAATGTAPVLIDNDKDKVTIDFDGDGRADVGFNFTNSIVNDSVITFDIEGTSAWSDSTINNNGYFEFSADFLGGTTSDTSQDIEFDIGSQWDGASFVNGSLTSTQYSRASTTTFQSADGYGAGDLEGVDVGVDGVITGIFSNGELIPLYRVSLAKFLNNQGLYKEGGNLYRETRDSGAATTSRPGTNGLGNIQPNSLEQSNVDIASEFVKMITSQRGFQANSKIITTVDQMLAETIQMKR